MGSHGTFSKTRKSYFRAELKQFLIAAQAAWQVIKWWACATINRAYKQGHVFSECSAQSGPYLHR